MNCNGVEFIVAGNGLRAKALAVGSNGYQNCALDQTDEIVCWGVTANHDYCDSPICSEVPGGQFKSIVLSSNTNYGACAIDVSDSIQCWGNDDMSGIPAGSFVEIGGAHNFMCALNTLGEISCWSATDTALDFTPPQVLDTAFDGLRAGLALDYWSGRMLGSPNYNGQVISTTPSALSPSCLSRRCKIIPVSVLNVGDGSQPAQIPHPFSLSQHSILCRLRSLIQSMHVV